MIIEMRTYDGELWKGELEGILMPMLEKYDVVLVDDPDGCARPHLEQPRRRSVRNIGRTLRRRFRRQATTSSLDALRAYSRRGAVPAGQLCTGVVAVSACGPDRSRIRHRPRGGGPRAVQFELFRAGRVRRHSRVRAARSSDAGGAVPHRRLLSLHGDRRPRAGDRHGGGVDAHLSS